jgi:ATP-binding cassette subfamily B protein
MSQSRPDKSNPPEGRQRLTAAYWALRQLWGSCSGLVIGIIVCTIVQGLVPAGYAVALRGLINSVAEIDTQAANIYLAPLSWLGLAFALTVIDSVMNQVFKYYSDRMKNDLTLHFNTRVMNHASQMDLPYFENRHTREIIDRVSRDPGGRLHALFFQLQKTALSVLQIVTLAGILIWLEPWILAFAFLLTVPFFWFNIRLARARYEIEAARSLKQRKTQYFLQLLTRPSQVGEIKILGIGGLLTQRFAQIMEEFREQDRKLHVRQLKGSSAFMVPIIAAFFFLFGKVVLRVIEGDLTVGDLAMFGGAIVRLRTAVDVATRSASSAFEATLHINDLRSFLDSQAIVLDESRSTPPPLKGELRVQKLNFTYPGSSKQVLQDVSFHIPPGQTVAVVGRNGSGKSTLAKLLLRLYDADSGDILIDGTPIRNFPLQEYHRQVALVAQDFGRIEDSIANNLAFADWDRLREDRAEIERIACETGLDQVAATLPEGLDTPLGRIFAEHDFSGGQWQLLAAARMLARNAAIYILDEPTSNIDAVAEHRLIESFERLAGNRTKIIISHRFSTISMAEQILVMDQGRVVEQGNHHELLAQDGHYALLYRMHEDYRAELND